MLSSVFYTAHLHYSFCRIELCLDGPHPNFCNTRVGAGAETPVVVGTKIATINPIAESRIEM